MRGPARPSAWRGPAEPHLCSGECSRLTLRPSSEVAAQLLVDFDDGAVLLHTFFDPERPIPPEITQITGISDEMVVGAPNFRDYASLINDIVHSADVFIGHNPWFDRGMLAGEFRRLGMNVQFPRLVCTRRLWDVYEPKEKRHLQNAYKRFVDRAGFEGAHGALADTRACHAVIKAQIEQFDLIDKKWEEFDPEQARWCGPSEHLVIVDGVIVVNFGKHKGTPVHLVDRGYWNWIVQKDFPEHVKVFADYMTVVAPPGVSAEQVYSFAYGKFLR